jgi:putative hydrolase of the HAD superfamily
MRSVLGYDELFDVSCYSYDLGVAKPDVGFFTEAARRIAADPSTILFIDDMESNVEGARAAGFAAEHWHFERGHDALHDLLAGHEVVVARPNYERAATISAATRWPDSTAPSR